MRKGARDRPGRPAAEIKRVHKTIMFLPEEWDAVQTAAADRRLSASALVRKAVKEFLARPE